MLQKIVEDLGATLIEQDYRPDVFGSALAVYSQSGNSIRIVWDGKEGWGILQSPQSDGSWKDAAPLLKECDLEGVPKNHAKIQEFTRAAAGLLSAGAA